MKRLITIMAVIGLLMAAGPVMATDCGEIETTVPPTEAGPAVDYSYINGQTMFDYNRHCCPFPIMFQAQGVVTDLILTHQNVFSVTATAAAGQLQFMMGSGGTQNQSQTVTYGSITIEQSQHQSSMRQSMGCDSSPCE
jgi:hypothetical protein